MKKLQLLAIMAILLFISCSDDHDEAAHTHPQEVFTTMTITLVPSDGSSDIILQTEDLDGDGPNAPAITVSGKLKASNTYTGSIKWYNKTATPVQELTSEIVGEKDVHQIFYTIGSGLTMTVSDLSKDSTGNDFGHTFSIKSLSASSGKLTVTLIHEPTKPNGGNLSTAGGATDIAATFDVVIE